MFYSIGYQLFVELKVHPRAFALAEGFFGAPGAHGALQVARDIELEIKLNGEFTVQVEIVSLFPLFPVNRKPRPDLLNKDLMRVSVRIVQGLAAAFVNISHQRISIVSTCINCNRLAPNERLHWK